jgi:DNA gyrase/topoisomerase IV subunit A
MIRKGDIQWWVLEAKKSPESAPAIIEELAKRLAELDAENERLRADVIRLQRHAPTTAGDSEVSTLRRRVETLQGLLDKDTSAEPSVIILSDRLQSARLPLPEAVELAQGTRRALNSQTLPGFQRLLLPAQPQDELLLLTSQGRGLKVLPTDVPTLPEAGNCRIAEGGELADGERVTAALAVTDPPRFWTFVTRRAYVRQLIHVGLERMISQDDLLIESPARNDALVTAVNGDWGDLLLITRWGKGVRFPQRAIASQGSIALELEPDDLVVGALPLPSDTEIVIVTAGGYAARRDTAQLKARSRPGSAGKTLIQAYDVLGIFPWEADARLLYLTYAGDLVLVPAADVPLHERATKGTQVHDFGRDPAVAVALVPGAS